jgi:hypothetical protein
MSITYSADIFRGQTEIEIIGVEGDVVVAQAMPLEEGVLHRSAETVERGSGDGDWILRRTGYTAIAAPAKQRRVRRGERQCDRDLTNSPGR